MRNLGLMLLLSYSFCATAAMFPLPKKGDDVVGQVQTTQIQQGDNFATIAQRYNVTYTGLLEANPGINPDHPLVGTAIIVPSAYVLPDVPRKGIVINLAELRLYYYPAKQKVVYTYPVGIGVQGWVIPPGSLKIVEKQKDPTWYIPPAVHQELKEKGFNLPAFIPPGPDNPLGGYMLRLSAWTYLIHGVVDPSTVGRRSSSGCFRMYPENIQEVFNMVPVGTPVQIINDPYKIGWQNGKLMLEAHLPLQEQQAADAGNTNPLTDDINQVIGKKAVNVNWDHAFALANQHSGVPEQIGVAG